MSTPLELSSEVAVGGVRMLSAHDISLLTGHPVSRVRKDMKRERYPMFKLGQTYYGELEPMCDYYGINLNADNDAMLKWVDDVVDTAPRMSELQARLFVDQLRKRGVITA